MSIANGLGRTGYGRTMPQRIEGAPADFDGLLTHPMRNPFLAQVSNVAIGTFDTDTDSITVEITTPDGEVHPYTVTRAAGAPADATAAAVALAALVNADAELLDDVVASGSTTNLVLTFRHPNVVYPVSATPSAGTTATVTTTTAAGASTVPFGRAVIAGTTLDGITAIALPSGVSNEFLVLGVTARPQGQFESEGSPLSSAEDGIPGGRMCDVAFDGPINVVNRGDVATVKGGVVYMVVNTAGGDPLGGFRSDDDGANSIPLSQIRVHWDEVVAPGAVGPIRLRAV